MRIVTFMLSMTHAIALRSVRSVAQFGTLSGDRCVLFHARGCRVCTVATTRLQKLQEVTPQIKFYSVQVDKHKALLDLTKSLEITTVPTLMIVRQGIMCNCKCSSKEEITEISQMLSHGERSE